MLDIKGYPRGDIIKDQKMLPGKAVLVHNLSVERNTQGTQEKSCVLVGLGSSVESDVATRNHLGGIPRK